MSVNEALKSVIADSGRTQTWVITRVNRINPNVNMTKNKLCSALNGKRKITGDEFIALCKALEINPDSIAEMVIGTKKEVRM